MSVEPQDLDIGATVTAILAEGEMIGPSTITVDIKVTHEPLDPEDPRQQDDVVITFDKFAKPGMNELEYLADVLETTAKVLRDAEGEHG